MKDRRKIVTTGAITSRKLASVSDCAERLYWRVYMASDNYGTMSADAWDVLGMCMPNVRGWTEQLVSESLDELVAVGLLVRWSDGEDEWLHVDGHDRHQSADFIRKRGARRSPVPPKGAQGQRRAAKGSEGQTTSNHAVPCPSGEKGTLSTPTSTTTTTNTPPPPNPQSEGQHNDHSAAVDEGPEERTDELPSGVTPDELIRAEIRKARGRLGVIAAEGDGVARAWRGWNPSAPISRERREVWDALSVLATEFSDHRTELAQAMQQAADSKKPIGKLLPWLRATTKRIIRDAEHAAVKAPGGSRLLAGFSESAKRVADPAFEAWQREALRDGAL